MILLLENNENDVSLFRRALAAADYRGGLRVVESATDARAYMENSSLYGAAAYYAQPQLIVCDYRLAGATAMELVYWLRQKPAFAQIPVLIISGVVKGLTGEQFETLGVIAFIEKTGNVQEFAQALTPLLPPVP